MATSRRHYDTIMHKYTLFLYDLSLFLLQLRFMRIFPFEKVSIRLGHVFVALVSQLHAGIHHNVLYQAYCAYDDVSNRLVSVTMFEKEEEESNPFLC